MNAIWIISISFFVVVVFLVVMVFAPYTPDCFLPLRKVSFSMLEIMNHRSIDLRKLKRAALWAHQPDPWGDGFATVFQLSQTGGFSAAVIQTKQHLRPTVEDISFVVGTPRGLNNV